MMELGFTGCPLDREDHVRLDQAALARLAADPDARLLHLNGLDPVLDDAGQLQWIAMPGSAQADHAAARDADGEAGPLLFLGRLGGAPRFASLAHPGIDALRAMPAMHALSIMPFDEAAIWGTAKSLIDWHARHGFCAVCGSQSTVFRGGWGRRCDYCNAEHYPRVDPVVIMLAEHDGRVLVGRQSRFPPRFYSALAGFIEPGESLEEAVRRELFEEAGVRAGAVRYLASQPWPYPSSLMIGCFATCDDDALTLDQNEIEDAFWASRDEVRAALAGDPAARFTTPPSFAIAHTLLASWAAEG